MSDLLFLLIALGFFALMAGFIRLCEQLMEE